MSTPEENAAAERLIHQQADAAKANLTTAEGVHVSRGDEVVPPARVDPFEARKALFLKSNRLHEEESNTARQMHPTLDALSGAMVDAMEAEAAGGRVPAQVDTTGRPLNNSPTPPSQQPQGDVSLQLNGRTITVARSDVERAGGEASYLRTRQMDDQQAGLDRQAEAMRQQAENLRIETEQQDRLRAEQLRSQAAGREAPARAPGSTTGQGSNPGESSADLESRAAELANQIYSGEVGSATKAIASLLSDIRDAKQTGQMSVQRANELATTLQQREHPAAVKPQQPNVIDPAYERVRQQINTMGASEYPALHNNPEASMATRDEIIRLTRLPGNRDRLAIDVAREACDNMMAKYGPRAQAQSMKQGLPVSSAVGGQAPVATEEAIPTGSEAVRMMQARRNFGNRNG